MPSLNFDINFRILDMNISKKVGIWLSVSTEFQLREDLPEHHENAQVYIQQLNAWMLSKYIDLMQSTVNP